MFEASKSAATGALEFIKQVDEALDKADAYMGGKSLIDVTRHARVEPMLIIDSAALGIEYLKDVTQTMQNLFACYYMQAVHIITTLDGVSVAEVLSPLNPNRKVDVALMNAAPLLPKAAYDHQLTMIDGAYQFRLPTSKNYKTLALGMEAYRPIDDEGSGKSTMGNMARGDLDEQGRAEHNKNSGLMELSSLCIGKLYNVTISRDGKSATIPVSIRVMANNMPTRSLTAMLSHRNVFDNDLKERWLAARQGRISFFKDLIFCHDLIEKHRNASVKDKSGIYDQIMSTKNSSVIAGLLERNPSMAVYSNLCIVTRDTMDKIEFEVGGPITNQKIRRAMFDNGYLMILCIIDPGYDRVTFYQHGIDKPTSMSLREMKISNKGDGLEVLTAMRGLMEGRPVAI